MLYSTWLYWVRENTNHIYKLTSNDSICTVVVNLSKLISKHPPKNVLLSNQAPNSCDGSIDTTLIIL